MPLRQQQQQAVESGRADIKFFNDDGGFHTDFRPLSGITTRMLQARNICATGCRKPSRFLEGTAIPNSVIRRELDTPTPDEEHKAWIEHVMNTVAPRIISRLQQPLKQSVTLEEPIPFDRTALPTVSEMRLQREREELHKLQKEAHSKLEAASSAAQQQRQHQPRPSIAFGKRSTQECIQEAISRSKEIQDMITAKVLGHSFRNHESAPSMEIISDSIENCQVVKHGKRGKKGKKVGKKTDSETTNEEKNPLKEDRVLQLIHSIKEGKPAELARQRNSLTTELRLMQQYRTNLEKRAMCSGLDRCEQTSQASERQQESCLKCPGASPWSPPHLPQPKTKKRALSPCPPRCYRSSRSPPSSSAAAPRVIKRSPDRCNRPTLTPHITNVGMDPETQANIEKYGPPKVLLRRV